MTRKILVPIDIDNPSKKINDFLYPDPTENGFVLRRIKTGKEWKFGIVILTSEINENDIFKKIVDSGKKIESVDKLRNSLKDYVLQMPTFKIGNVLKLNENETKVEFVIEFQRLTKKK